MQLRELQETVSHKEILSMEKFVKYSAQENH